MADPTRSASTDFSAGSEGAAERQYYGYTTVLEINVMIINQFSTCVLIFRHSAVSVYL